MSVSVAPDECTIYYNTKVTGAFADQLEIDRYNVCTSLQESSLDSQSSTDFLHQIRVLANWQILGAHETRGLLLDASAKLVREYSFPVETTCADNIAPDPDGTSMWMGGDCEVSGEAGHAIGRFDLGSRQMLTEWVPAYGQGSIAVYGPPLVGNPDLGRSVDSSTAGTAEAFLTRASYSGRLTSVHLYVDSPSTASQVDVGIYSDRLGRPGELLEQGTTTNVRPASWNYVDVQSSPVTAGRLDWLAILGPRRGGRAGFRDRRWDGLAMISARHDLSNLPTHWSGGRWTLASSVSAYGT